MPLYDVAASRTDIARNALLLDTNVLVAAFLPNDQHHEVAREFIDAWPEPFIVPVTVLIEAWGMIVGSRKQWSAGSDLLAWLSSPGHVSMLPQETVYLGNVFDLIRQVRIDCVDAFLSYLADNISDKCSLSPHIRIATYDTSDFLNSRERYGLRLNLFDLRSLDEY